MPENPTEEAVVKGIKQRGLEVAVFLVGRQALPASFGLGGYGSLQAPVILIEPSATTPWRRLMNSPMIERGGLQGPVSVTSPLDAELPDAALLLAEGKTALSTIGQNPGYDIKHGDWTLAMRPLRASNQTCIQCHTSVDSAPKLGDTLGVVMYVYRRRD